MPADHRPAAIGTALGSAGWRGALVSLALIIVLFWPAIVNRQPILFSDTTAYVRAGDLIMLKASGGRFTSDWTQARAAPAAAARVADRGGGTPAAHRRVNDASGGTIMAGRSPYFGALLFLGYLLGDFWPFVFAQAAIAFYLITRALKFAGTDSGSARAITVLALAAFSSVAIYDSILLADALAGFGILAALLLMFRHDAASRVDRLALFALAALSATAHLTHILVLLAMALAALALRVLLRQARETVSWRGTLLVLAAAAVGVASVMLTTFAIRQVFGAPPQLVPLLTARFVEDGPGSRYIDEHCPRAGFAVCEFKGRYSTVPNAFLWSTTPGAGVFLLATPAQRRRLSAEDTAFALAVLKAYPARQLGMMLFNTADQFVTIRNRILNYYCTDRESCWDAVPVSVGARMLRSPSGRRRWPVLLLNTLHWAGLVAATGLFALAAARFRDRFGARTWLSLGVLLVALVVNAFLCGALSETQGRYQARVMWLPPLFACVLASRMIAPPRARSPARRDGPVDAAA